MKIIKNLTFAATAFLLSLWLQTSTAQAGGKPQIEVTFTKWVTAFPQMEGFFGGDAGTGFFAGEVLNLTQIADGHIWKIDARYGFIADDPSKSFTALMHGKHSWHTGIGVLNGVITEGWHAGAQVHVVFQSIPDDVFGFAFQGTLTINPN